MELRGRGELRCLKQSRSDHVKRIQNSCYKLVFRAKAALGAERDVPLKVVQQFVQASAMQADRRLNGIENHAGQGRKGGQCGHDGEHNAGGRCQRRLGWKPAVVPGADGFTQDEVSGAQSRLTGVSAGG